MSNNGNYEKFPSIQENGFGTRLRNAFLTLIGSDEVSEQKEQLAQEVEELRRGQSDVISRERALSKREREILAKEQELAKREAAIKAEELRLQKEAEKLANDRKGLETKEATMNKSIGLVSEQAKMYANAENMPSDISDIKIHAQKAVALRFEKLQGELEELETALKAIEDTDVSKKEKRRIKDKYIELKGKLYGNLAVALEIMSPLEISKCTIGDKNVSLRNIVEQLPTLIGLQQGRMAGPALKEYKEGLLDLYKIGALKGDDRNIGDFDLISSGNSAFTWLLSSRLGIRELYSTKNSDSIQIIEYEPLRNFTLAEGIKNTKLQVIDAPDSIGKTLEKTINVIPKQEEER